MNFDLLISSQASQAGLSDLPKKMEVSKENFMPKEHAEFKTRESNDVDETNTAKKSNFADLLSKLEKNNAKSKIISDARDAERSKAEAVSALPDSVLTQIAKQTAVDDTHAVANTLDTGTDTADTSQDMLVQITQLGTEIKNLLKAIKDGTQGIETPATLRAEVPAAADETNLKDQLLKLYAVIVDALKSGEVSAKPTEDQVKLLDQLNQILADPKNLPLLANMTPEQMTKLQQSIENILKGQQTKDDQAMLEALAAQFVMLTPPQNVKQDTAQQIKSKIDDVAVNDTKSNTLQPDISQTPSSATLPEKHFTQSRYDDRYNIKSQPLEQTPDADSQTDFKSVMKDADAKAFSAKIANDNATSSGGGAQKLLQTSGLDTLNSALNGLSQGSQSTSATAVAQSPAATFQSSLTNVVTQSSSAAYPHPATQAVAATIQKAVKEGQDTNIKLQLDPPELGRVEVKMSISKDSTTKIVLTVEKPETLNLLQRDAQVLDRALHNAGLDTQGSLSFELARDNQNFGQNNNRGGGHDKGGTGAASGTENDNTIETTMNWRVDPRTGMMHYNVLA